MANSVLRKIADQFPAYCDECGGVLELYLEDQPPIIADYGASLRATASLYCTACGKDYGDELDDVICEMVGVKACQRNSR